MEFFDILMQLDWTRAARLWILIGAVLCTWEAAHLFGRALAQHRKERNDAR
jgi:hypothetical protein